MSGQFFLASGVSCCSLAKEDHHESMPLAEDASSEHGKIVKI